MSSYTNRKQLGDMPRIPLAGNIDLTYRCNNNCRHCWLRLTPGAPEKRQELSFEEIKDIVDQARNMGCREWRISGGEPMLRSDFPEIFDYITSKSITYSLNTNGTLITPEIAELMTRKGNKMVAIYGADEKVNDHITRNPGSFKATMRGIELLKDAGASFMVQVVPMKDNFHQYAEMEELARSLSKNWRIGASWLYLSASGDPKINAEIKRQRLDPKDAFMLDPPDFSHSEHLAETRGHYAHTPRDDSLFTPCLTNRTDFHVDPYGFLGFCSYVKEPSLRYDLHKGSLQDGWENFIPALVGTRRGGEEYEKNCGSCKHRDQCRWCPVYGFLEHRNLSAKVEYLCSLIREKEDYKKNWFTNHRRNFRVGGIDILVESLVPFDNETFSSKLRKFQVESAAESPILLKHRFSFPDIKQEDLGPAIYHKPPWAIYRKGKSWIYLGIYPDSKESNRFHKVVVFNESHTRATIYSKNEEVFRKGDLLSLSQLPTDQILLARILADREGCLLHSSAVILNGKGLLFVGHSESGKSTIANMLKTKAEILCDDRNIVRRKGQGDYTLHGTWSHGDIPDVSANFAPLKAVFFLRKARKNHLEPITDRKTIISRLLACLVKPLLTTDWWEKEMDLAGTMARELPFYEMEFDRSGDIMLHLQQLVLDD